MTQLLRGQKVPAGLYVATVLPEIDFETYSEAGYFWDAERARWTTPPGTSKGKKPGLGLVGAARYFEHPSTEVLLYSYDLKDGLGVRRGDLFNPPADLIAWLSLFDPTAPPSYDQAGIIEAHNAKFEIRVFVELLHKRYGWPLFRAEQFRCSMAKAAAHCLPLSLGNLSDVLQLPESKDKEGERLLKLFSVPQTPTKKQPLHRVYPTPDSTDGQALAAYCDQDIRAEGAASIRIPDLRPDDLAFWLMDLRCNLRGVQIDVETAEAACDIIRQAQALYDPEIYQLTGGVVARTSEVSNLISWLNSRVPGLVSGNLDDDVLTELEARTDLPPDVQRAVRLRAMTSSASVKKVFAMTATATSAGRAHDLHQFNGARTGRDVHLDLQPGNLPKAGPMIRWCQNAGCFRPYAHARAGCPWCGTSDAFSSEVSPPDENGETVGKGSWCWQAVPFAVQIIRTRRLDWLQDYFGDAYLAIIGCIRGMFTAAPGHTLISSDYSSIEAVVAACLSGEQWRIDSFRRGEDIYLASASRITGKPLEWYMANGGKKHPDRAKLGKFAELALGFGGWVNGWRGFDKSDTFTDEELKKIIVAWRDASPCIVEMWGGQVRGKPWRPDRFELYGLEGMAVAALLDPGSVHSYRGIKYQVLQGTLYCTLLSGRQIAYHGAHLVPVEKFEGVSTWEIRFWGWNTNPKKGAKGWILQTLYGGLMFENVVQATANDFLRAASVALEAAGFPPVIRIHDELVCEIPEPTTHMRKALVQEFERIMVSVCKTWAPDWPIRAAGGWIGLRFRKDA